MRLYFLFYNKSGHRLSDKFRKKLSASFWVILLQTDKPMWLKFSIDCTIILLLLNFFGHDYCAVKIWGVTELVSIKLKTHHNCYKSWKKKRRKEIDNKVYYSWFGRLHLDQNLPTNCVLYMRQVTFLVEGARTVITLNQLFLCTFTDAALIIVSVILLTRQELWLHTAQFHAWSFCTRRGREKSLLVCNNLNSNLYCSSLEETQVLYRHCSCRARMNGEWGNAAWLISKLTRSLQSGLHSVQLHSSEWIFKMFAWNRQIKSVFLLVPYFIVLRHDKSCGSPLLHSHF